MKTGNFRSSFIVFHFLFRIHSQLISGIGPNFFTWAVNSFIVFAKFFSFACRYPFKTKTVGIQTELFKVLFLANHSSFSFIIATLIMTVTWMTSADEYAIASFAECKEYVLRVHP